MNFQYKAIADRWKIVKKGHLIEQQLKWMNVLSKWNIIINNKMNVILSGFSAVTFHRLAMCASSRWRWKDEKGVNFRKIISLEITILMLKSTHACIHKQNMSDCWNTQALKLTRNSSAIFYNYILCACMSATAQFIYCTMECTSL